MGMAINGIIHRLDRTKERITELEEEKSVALFPTEIQKGKRGDGRGQEEENEEIKEQW